jgi:PAS domain S-box-containing protein
MGHEHAFSSYMEHGACFSWEPGLVWLHVLSDILTGIAYFSIPVGMFYFAYKRRDLPFHYVFLLFGIFIMACGATHFLAAYTVFVADYWIEGGVKAFTALISAVSAFYFIPMIPKAIAMPSLTKSLEENQELNAQLQKRVAELNASEEALRVAVKNAENEKAKTEAIIAGIGDGISIQDREYRIIYQNQVQKDLVGDHVGDFCYEVYDGGSRVCDGCTLDASFRDGRIHTTERSGTVNGTPIFVEVTASPLRDGSGNIVAGIEVVRNIEDRKKAERRLGRNIRLLSSLRKVDQTIFRGAKVRETLGVVCDAIMDMGYRFCWVGLKERDGSVRVAALRGAEEGAFASFGIRWDDSPQDQGPSGSVIRTGQRCLSQDLRGIDPRIPWKDAAIEWGLGSFVSLPLKSDASNVFGVLHVYSGRENGFSPEDIGDLETFADQCVVAILSSKQVEELRDAHQRLAFHVNRMPLAYIVWDKDFHVVEWNPAAERIFGWKAEEAVGKHPHGLIVAADSTPHVDKVWAKLLGGDEASYSLNTNIRSDGKKITCEWFNAPLRDASGNVTGVLSMVHDVTEKTQLERQLQSAQRMEAVGTLAGGIAHDFNNALTGIFGFGEMLRMQLAGDERALSNLVQVMRCAERAAKLTRQLLTYARRQIIDPVNLNLNSVITDLMKLVSKVVGEHIEIRTYLGRELPTIRADMGQIEQVVMNLVINARDAMPAGGQLRIETGLANLDAEYVRIHPYMQAGSYVVLTVADTGIGMDGRTQERVFEPFFTTKSPDKGTGLGLAVVYGIVKQHNGFIHLYSEPGKGTSFKIYFPPVEAAPDAKEAAIPAEIRGGTETVLLAEDDDSVRVLVERMLTELGYTVLPARDGEEAIEVFHRNREKISLALLDVVMPGKGGKEAYEAMHKEAPGLPVIFMSGYTADTVHESFVLIAGVPFLAKPFGPDALARKVRAVLEG